jgi:colanic acid/amylovoran biosynthesis protein
MPTKILFTGIKLCRNLGGPSLLVSTKRVLDQFFMDAEYTLISSKEEDLALADVYNVRVIPWRFIWSLPALLTGCISGIPMGSKLTKALVSSFAEADVIIDISGIMFCDSLLNNRFMTRALEGFHLALGKMFRKPVIKYTADIGPFKSTWNRFFARLYLQNFVDLILARNDNTRQRLSALGVSTPVRVCPDTAFLLEPRKSTFSERLGKMKANHPLVGFSVSFQAAKQAAVADNYLKDMASLADYIIRSKKARIVLIPNDLSQDALRDDVSVAREIFGRMSKQDETIIFSKEYDAWEMKGVIGQCDVLLAARYHSMIAGLSQGIPVLAIGWHDKYPEALRLVGQEQCLGLVRSLDLNDLQKKFDSLWHERLQIKNQINGSLPGIRERILQGGKEVSLLLKKQ